MRRRDVLRGMGAGVGIAGLGLAGRGALASGWGLGESKTAQQLLLPTGVRAERVLEVFMYGGLSPWETFYVAPAYGDPKTSAFPNTQWHMFAADHQEQFGTNCGLTDPSTWLLPWATDSNGTDVFFGPLVMPLRDRVDVLNRTRVLVMQHDLEPHEAAIPYAMSGFRLGNPRMAGLGAHVQRYFQGLDTTGRVLPFSYVFYPDGEFDTDNLRAASAVGLHPGSTRPLDLRVNANSDLPQRLARARAGAQRGNLDALVAHLTQTAGSRYVDSNGLPLRSKAMADHAFASTSLAQAADLEALLPPEVLANLPGSSCLYERDTDATLMSLEIARHLLTHPTASARHVTVVDGGLVPASGGGGYDVHSSHMNATARNALRLLDSLMSIINEPGENDPTKIDLDTTLIVLNTEFGRTPYIQPGTGNGTNHHPYGYVTTLIGGPVTADRSGLVGAIGEDGIATDFVTPIESRAAVLAAMGIYPFTQESFAIGDLRNFADELDGLAWLNEHVLGVV
ncbi:MAG: DUF1501 domain-containing protein [Myxococcota bacterium]